MSTDTAIVIDGQSNIFTCTVTSADEEASVYWTLDNTLTSDDTENDLAVEINPDCNSPEDIETFSFMADHNEHHGQTLQCIARNSADLTGKIDDINIDVHGKKCVNANVNSCLERVKFSFSLNEIAVTTMIFCFSVRIGQCEIVIIDI